MSAGSSKNVIIPNRVDCKKGDFINNRYLIERELGEGAFGCVYEVTDTYKNRWALKLLRLWDVPANIRQHLVDRFEMEFQTGRISSPNLVHSADFGYMKGNPFIVMELCEGGDLSSKLGREDANPSKCAREILQGLKALHINGKVHRDLKPENVLFKGDGTAVLTDFGISGDRNKRMTERNIFGKPYQMFGTYAYMPPEQVNRARGETTVLPTTDIFSFGVMLYQLLTGSLPFGRLEDHNDLVNYQKRGKAGDWDRYALRAVRNGVAWERVIEGCLQPDYKHRLQSVDIVMQLIPESEIRVTPKPVVPVATRREVLKSADCILRVMMGEEYGKVYDLNAIIQQYGKCLITFGRGSANMVCLKEYDTSYISRSHFTLEYHAGKHWVVRDGQWSMDEGMWKRSSNGTYLDSAEVTDHGAVLYKNAVLSVGEMKLRFEEKQ